MPTADALDLTGLNIPASDVAELLKVDLAGWRNEIADVAANYAKFGDKLPKALADQLESLKKRIG